MTNYEKIQKASPDHLIDILCAINCDPCEGCICQCGEDLAKRLEVFLRNDYDCNTSNTSISTSNYLDRLKELHLSYASAIKNLDKVPNCDIVETYQAIEFAISLVEQLED